MFQSNFKAREVVSTLWLFRILGVISGLILPYAAINAWNFTLGVGAILVGGGPKNCGLPRNMKEYAQSLMLLVGFSITAAWLIRTLCGHAGITLSSWQFGAIYLRPLTQSLAEELVFRGLLLRIMTQTFKLTPRFTSMNVAVFFSLSHLGFYALRDHVILNTGELLTLGAFSLLINDLYFAKGHIGWGYALHAGWNLTRFTTNYSLNGAKLLEGSTYAFVEGAPTLVAVSLFISLFLHSKIFHKKSGRS